MSGGSLDYVSFKVEEAAERLETQDRTPLIRAFAAHLRLVSKALHDVEWMLSGDTSPGDEEEAIRAVIVNHKEKIFDVLKKEAEETIKQLQELIK